MLTLFPADSSLRDEERLRQKAQSIGFPRVIAIPVWNLVLGAIAFVFFVVWTGQVWPRLPEIGGVATSSAFFSLLPSRSSSSTRGAIFASRSSRPRDAGIGEVDRGTRYVARDGRRKIKKKSNHLYDLRTSLDSSVLGRGRIARESLWKECHCSSSLTRATQQRVLPHAVRPGG